MNLFAISPILPAAIGKPAIDRVIVPRVIAPGLLPAAIQLTPLFFLLAMDVLTNYRVLFRGGKPA